MDLQRIDSDKAAKIVNDLFWLLFRIIVALTILGGATITMVKYFAFQLKQL